MNWVLQTHGLMKRFGGFTVTDGVSLKVALGARHALIGPNGAGKTTLINLLTGVLEPTGGRVELLGEDITGLAPHRRVGRGLVRTFQINQLWPTQTPAESLALAVAQRCGQGRRWWRPLGGDSAVTDECDQLLAEFHLVDFAARPVKELPYGKQRLLELALAISSRPRVLLLDEPAAGVPAGEREEIFESLRRLPQDVSVLLIEHDMDLVFNFAKQVTVLVSGAIFAEGDVDRIARDPRVKAVYLGEGAHA